MRQKKTKKEQKRTKMNIKKSKNNRKTEEQRQRLKKEEKSFDCLEVFGQMKRERKMGEI